jgi:hypothetical protein
MARVAGDVAKFEIEKSQRPENVDHVYITIDAGLKTPVVLSVNTLSFRSRVAGHDPRVRLGTLSWRWTHLPPRGLYPLEFFDYDTVELIENVEYRVLERGAMEEYFALRCANCRRVEAWGVPYPRAEPGLHQIHSRRASAAVIEDLRGRDGAVARRHVLARFGGVRPVRLRAGDAAVAAGARGAGASGAAAPRLRR